jgi:hypothetical protein
VREAIGTAVSPSSGPVCGDFDRRFFDTSQGFSLIDS